MFSLVFVSVFLIITGGLLSVANVQRMAALREQWRMQAFHIAEAGLNYYRWHLAHAPEDFVSDIGEHPYNDPYAGDIGAFSIEVIPPQIGSSVVTIRSTGWSSRHPDVKKVIEARYGIRSLTDRAFITNSNVWFGQGEEVRGEVHSNGGIRMDGEGDSLMTSSKLTYICGTEHGCNDEEKPGIWGTGEKPELWDFPVDDFDFDAVTLDLQAMQTEAINSGFYIGDSGAEGYRLELLNTGKFNLYKVTRLQSPVWGYDGTDWVYTSHSIRSVSALRDYQNVPLPANGLIFIEDELWVDGTTNGKVTIVAARLPDDTTPDASILINGNTSYPVKDGSSTLGLIAQGDLLIPLYSPDKLEIDAALLAQKGHVFRYLYPGPAWGWNSPPYSTYALRSKIETYGSVISNGVWTWSWVDSEEGPVISGYQVSETSYDPHLTFGPPPFFPTTGEYTFISWEEKPAN
jgi:hypothetical protein